MREVTTPQPQPGELRVAVHAAAVCGSDVHGFRGDNDRRRPGTVMGHETSGTVDAVGADVDPSWRGRPVVVNPLRSCGTCPACAAGRENLCPVKAVTGCVPDLPGAFADFLVVPLSAVVPWPVGVPLSRGALVEPFAVGLHAAELTELSGRRVVVVGGGVVALATALAAWRRGAVSVDVLVRTAQRRDVLATFGLQAVVSAMAPSPPADVAFDCVATSESLATAMAATRTGGSVVVVGFAADHALLPMTALVHGERIVHGSAQYTAESYRRTATWLSEDGDGLDGVLSASYRLEEGPEVLHRLATEESVHLRSLLAPNPLTP